MQAVMRSAVLSEVTPCCREHQTTWREPKLNDQANSSGSLAVVVCTIAFERLWATGVYMPLGKRMLPRRRLLRSAIASAAFRLSGRNSDETGGVSFA